MAETLRVASPMMCSATRLGRHEARRQYRQELPKLLSCHAAAEHSMFTSVYSVNMERVLRQINSYARNVGHDCLPSTVMAKRKCPPSRKKRDRANPLLNERVLDRLARSDEAELHLMLMCPCIHNATAEL